MKYFFILFLFMGCTHNTKLIPKGCSGNGKYSETSAEYKKVEEKVFLLGFDQEVSLKDILTSKKVDCRRIKYMNFTWKQTFFDALVSTLPLMTRKTLIIEYARE